MGNFSFLKNIDKDLFEIIDEAELLYRDEYFEQCMTQARRFGENVCKKVLGSKYTPDSTFDNMLADLSYMTNGSEQEKEFLEDLYFLKKCGNNSAHGGKVKKDGIEALECLQRAFEVAINYCVYNKKAAQNILSKRYDTELLITGKKSKKTLSSRYEQEKSKSSKKSKQLVKQSHKMVTQKSKKGLSLFWKTTIIFSVISILLLTAIIILVKI